MGRELVNAERGMWKELRSVATSGWAGRRVRSAGGRRRLRGPRRQNVKQTCGRPPGALDTGLPSNSLSSAETECPIILARDQGFVTGQDAEPLLAEVDELA